MKRNQETRKKLGTTFLHCNGNGNGYVKLMLVYWNGFVFHMTTPCFQKCYDDLNETIMIRKHTGEYILIINPFKALNSPLTTN